MLLLTSTSDVIQVVTGSAGTINVHASWMDNASGTVTPGRTNTATISTAATTTVVGSPAASTQRNVKKLNVYNADAAVTNFVTVQHTDGTNVEKLVAVTLLPGELLILDAVGGWTHYDANGGPYEYSPPAFMNLGLTGTIAETIPRQLCPEVSTAVGATGVLYMQAIYLPAGALISNINLWSSSTAAGTPTHYMAGLFDANRNLLATSTDKTTTAWGTNTQMTFAMVSPYRVLSAGLYYIGFFMAATTVVTLKGGTARTGGQLAGGAPILSGTSSSTGLTTALPGTAGAITAGTGSIYAAVS